MRKPLHRTSAEVLSHLLNQANARRALLEDDGDSAACVRVLGQACEARKEGRTQRGRVMLRIDLRL